jgi:hypothetical protein
METPHPGSLECLQIWLVRHRGKLEEKGHKFLSGSEEFMYHESIKLNDFVSVRAPRTDRDAFQETLSPKFVSLLIFLQKKFEHWFQSKVIRIHPD